MAAASSVAASGSGEPFEGPMAIQRPLVPADLRTDPVATLTRAALCVALAKLEGSGRTPVTEFANRWRDDRQLDTVLRAAVSPASIASTPALAQTTIAFLATLVPVSAGADLLNRALGLSFDGAAQITVPAIAVPTADFVVEMAPIPVQQATTSAGVSLVPHKLAVITSLTGEMMRNSNAEALVRTVLVESTGPAIDKVLFSANPSATDRPAGILNGITALTPAGPGEKSSALVDDLQALATAIAPVAGNGNIALIAAPAQAVAIALRLPPEIDWPLLTSASLPAGTVIAVATNALVSAVGGDAPQIDASDEVVVHEETAPAAIVTPGGALATPVRSFYQTDSVGLRLRWPISWALRDARGVAWMQNVNW